MKRERYMLHRVLCVGRYVYFASVKEARACAIERMKERGGRGFVYESLTGPNVIAILNDGIHDPIHGGASAAPLEEKGE